MKSPEEIVDIMLSKDAFSQWMGVELVHIGIGSCKLSCVIKGDMLNGFGIAHGGITYSLSDSALAFASNSYGLQCVSIETSISHLRPVKEGDKLDIEATEIHRGRSIGIYSISIMNQENKLVSKFKGTVHISAKPW